MVSITLFCVLTGVSAMAASPTTFVSASPVWLEGRETEMNVYAGFRAVVDSPGTEPVAVRIAAATLYRLYVNGEFVGHGPARGPHGYYRVDEWQTLPWREEGKNVVAIEVAGYNANSFYVLDQPSFLQAEVMAGEVVLAATGHEEHPFTGFALPERVQKVQRYSFQRPFMEVWRLVPGYDAWRADPEQCPDACALAVVESKQLLPRGVPYPRFDIQEIGEHVATGTFEEGKPKNRFRDRSLMNIGPELKGYPKDELELIASEIIEEAITDEITRVGTKVTPDTTFLLKAGTFHILDLGTNLTGFPCLHVECTAPTRLAVTFDEMLTEGDVNWRRLGCVNVLLFDLEPGVYNLEGFEPNTMRYMKVMALSGNCTVSNVGLRLYEHPDMMRATFACDSEPLVRIFDAGRTTFVQNTVDIPMDCPHRERAGWLCDSYFTSRSEFVLTGRSDVERNFLENYLLPESFAHLPEGMLPMCYPSDHYDGVFIPNWSLWFVLELGEFAARSGDEAFVAAFKPRVEGLFKYFSGLENEDGLLENLESWVFIEWSEANRFTQNVNYPSNMLYAAALDTAGKLFDESAWCEKAAAMRETIREQSLKDVFFVDNAERKDGKLVPTNNMTEVCQYFAFYFGVATPNKDPVLWSRLLDEFGPNRKEQGLYPEVHPANAFIGNMLRFELLSWVGRSSQLLHELQDYLMYMVDRTGTLWENIHDNASLNHGFASHITVSLFRDILGAYQIDPVNKTLHIRMTDVDLERCSGSIPVNGPFITMQWKRNADTIDLYYSVPLGFTVTVENLTNKTLNKVNMPLF